jgi:hypothetical protein
MSKKKEVKSSGMCQDTGCTNWASRSFKGPDGVKIRLCEKHFREWRGLPPVSQSDTRSNLPKKKSFLWFKRNEK